MANGTGLTCARCGRPMVRVARSLPQGQAVCHPCRRTPEWQAEMQARRRVVEQQRREEYRRLHPPDPAALAERERRRQERLAARRRRCAQCGKTFTAKTKDQRFCVLKCWHDYARVRNRPSGNRHTGTTTQRGYGTKHQALRRQFAELVDSGRALCARCGQPIIPGTLWDLGHADNDRSRYVGPEHRTCNRGAAARKTNSIRRAKSAERKANAKRATTIRW